MKVIYSDHARLDIAGIYDHIAQHSTVSAQRVEDEIRRTCEGLGDFPFASAETDQPNIRRVPLVIYPYAVFFRVNAEKQVVEIARVIHSARITDLRWLPKE